MERHDCTIRRFLWTHFPSELNTFFTFVCPPLQKCGAAKWFLLARNFVSILKILQWVPTPVLMIATKLYISKYWQHIILSTISFGRVFYKLRCMVDVINSISMGPVIPTGTLYCTAATDRGLTNSLRSSGMKWFSVCTIENLYVEKRWKVFFSP